MTAKQQLTEYFKIIKYKFPEEIWLIDKIERDVNDIFKELAK